MSPKKIPAKRDMDTLRSDEAWEVFAVPETYAAPVFSPLLPLLSRSLRSLPPFTLIRFRY